MYQIRDVYSRGITYMMIRNAMCSSYIITFLNVTVHAKTSLVCTKIEINFLPQLIATYISYLHSMSPMARLNWSAFLEGGFTRSLGTV